MYIRRKQHNNQYCIIVYDIVNEWKVDTIFYYNML